MELLAYLLELCPLVAFGVFVRIEERKREQGRRSDSIEKWHKTNTVVRGGQYNLKLNDIQLRRRIHFLLTN
jgi:hypothetical protein